MQKINLYIRYERQIKLKSFGEAGQQKLWQAKVLVIGAGGLGCPVLQYLAAAGVGTIGLVDDDVVSITNLHRQILYGTADVGKPKATCAASALQAMNNEIAIVPFAVRLGVHNALQIMEDFDIIVDGTDNFATRYLINDACVLLAKPVVYGAISQFEGQVAIFNILDNATNTAANYRDLFPQPPKDGEVANCAEAGVLGVLPGIIGTMMASETIKLITGIGEPLANKLFTYNLLNNQTYELEINPRSSTRSLIPANAHAFAQMNYDWLCAAPKNEMEINAEKFNILVNDKSCTIVDVRELHEQPTIASFAHLKIPLASLMENMEAFNTDNIIVFCQSGKRSLMAAQQLSQFFGTAKNIYSLQNGIVNWKNKHQPTTHE